jgi:hypothetical protein
VFLHLPVTLCNGLRLLGSVQLFCLKQHAEYLGPASFEVAVSLESALQQILDSLLRFRPSQRGLKRSDGGEQPVGGRQRDMVDEILRPRRWHAGRRRRSGARERRRAVQFGFWKYPVDVSVSFRGVAVEIVCAENDFERPAATDRSGPGIWVDMTTYWSYRRLSANESAIWRRILKHSD